jgi:hypothetical protein
MSMELLPRIMIPTVAALGVLYPATFLTGMWKAADEGQIETAGARIGGGSMQFGWRYDITQHSFPGEWRLSLSDAETGMGPLCAIEVRGGPMPVSASQGIGTLVHVTMAEPVEGRLRLSINLAEAFGRHCAVAIADGKIVRGDVPFGDNPTPQDAFPGELVAGRPQSGG